MRTVDIARRAARSLRNAKARTILTSLAIAVGAFTITISLAAGEGSRQYADKLIGSNINPKALFIVKDKALFETNAMQPGLREFDPNASTTNSGLTIKQLTQDDIDKLSARDDLEYVTPTYMPQVRYIEFADNDVKFVADVAAYDATIMSESAAGQLPPKGEQLADNEIVIPEAFAATLVDKEIVTNTEQLVGETVSLTVVRPPSSLSAEQISAAFASGGQAAVEALGQPETKTYDYTVKALSKQSSTALAASSSIQVSPNQARELTEYTTQGTEAYQKYVGVTALAKGDRDPAEVKASIESAGYAAQTARDLQSLIFTIVNTLQGIVLGFGVIALIASVFGIINTQYISVLERTREIGLMKALGMRGGNVSRLFQFEAAWIGLLGGVIGAVIAVLIGTALNPTITEALTLGDGNYLLIFELVPIVIMIVSLVLIAMLAGWFPARKAAKLDPIEALRTE